MLEIYIIDAEKSTKGKMNFTWECVDFTEYEMVLQLYFDYPAFISVSDKPQSIKLVFNSQTAFKDVSERIVWPGFELTKRLPRQMDYLSG